MVPDGPSEQTIDSLLDTFIEAIRAGQRPLISSYQVDHPHLAEEIAELFPVVAAMEGWKDAETSAHGGNQSLGGVPLKRLGDFRIVREIGRGGMGIVYEAIQESLHRRVAIKVLPPLAKSTGAAIDRFQREAKLSANLHHPNIVPVFGVGCENGFHFIAMQLIEGCGLDHLLYHTDGKRNGSTTDVEAVQTTQILTLPQSNGSLTVAEEFSRTTSAKPAPFSSNPLLLQTPDRENNATASTGLAPQRVAQIGMQAAEALEYAHQSGTLHRDIKPANLLIDQKNHLWVADFGLARALEHEALSRSGDIVGTLMYLAPERLHGQCDQRSDIYSLGLTLAELLLGAPVFGTNSSGSIVEKIIRGIPQRPGTLGNKIPADLETVILKSISVDPSHRYESAAAFASDLQAFLEDRPISAKPPTRVQTLRRWCRKNPLVAGLTSAVAALLIFTSILTTAGSLHQQKMRRRTEAMLDTTLGALDTMYARFAISDDSGSDAISDRAVISDEAANMLGQLLAVYDELASQGGDSTKLQREAIIAKLRVAEIHLRLGNLEQAVSQYRYAIVETNRLTSELEGKDQSDWQQRSIHAQLDLAEALELLGQNQESLSLRQQTLASLKAISVDAPTPSNRVLMAKTHYLLGRRPSLASSAPPSQNHTPIAPTSPLASDFQRRGIEGETNQGNRDRRFGQETRFGQGMRPSTSEDSENFSSAMSPRRGRGPGPLFRQLPGRRPNPFLMIPSLVPAENTTNEDAAQIQYRTEHLEAGLANINALHELHHDSPQTRLLHGLILLELAQLPNAAPESRNQLIDEVIGIHEALVQEFPGSDPYRFELAKTLFYAAQLRAETAASTAPAPELHTPDSIAQLESAEALLDRSIQFIRALHQSQPEIPEYSFLLSRTCESSAIISFQLAMVHGPPGPGNQRTRKAITSISEAVNLQSTLVNSDSASDMENLWLIRFKLTMLALQGITPESPPEPATYETIRTTLQSLDENPTIRQAVDDLRAELTLIEEEAQRKFRHEGPPPRREGGPGPF